MRCSFKFVDRHFNLNFMYVFLMLSSVINIKNLTYFKYCRVSVCVCVGGGSCCYNHSATVSRVDRCWRVLYWLQMHFTLTTRVGNNGNEHRR